jgi:hypothetical protein
MAVVLAACVVAALWPVPPRLVSYTSPPISLGHERFRVEMLLPERWTMHMIPVDRSESLMHMTAHPVHEFHWWDVPPRVWVGSYRDNTVSVTLFAPPYSIEPRGVGGSVSIGGGTSTGCSKQFGPIGASISCWGLCSSFYDEAIGRKICESFRVVR